MATPKHPILAETDRLEPLVRERPPSEWRKAIEELTPNPDVRWGLRERLHLVDHSTCSFSWYTKGRGHHDDKHICQEPKLHDGMHLCACGAGERRAYPRGEQENMKFALATILLLLTGCLFPAAPEPCPLPPEQHPEAWTPIRTAEGQTIGYACGAQ